MSGFNEVGECLEDDDIRARVVRLEKTSPRKVWKNRRGGEGGCGEEGLKSAGLLIFVTHFSIGGKNGRRLARFGNASVCASGDKLCGKVHKKCDARRHAFQW